MANIATLLARILSTRYGNEMRQDLHDSIEAVNNDTENALGKKLTFTTNTRKLKLLAKDDSVLSEVVISGGSGSGSVDSVNGLFPDENGNVEVNLDDINDVDITSAADGQILKYNSTSGKWVNGTGGGGTSDYSQLTNKPSVNGVTLSGNKTSADLGIFAPTITSPTSGQIIKYDGSNWVNGSVSGGGSNRNLLDNPWFTVNQKGFTSGSISYTIDNTFIDRWLNYQNWRGFSYSIGSNGLTFTKVSGQGGNMGQKFENSLSYGTYTLSILLSDNIIQSFVFTLSNDEPTVRKYTALNGVQCTLILSTTLFTIYSDGAYTGTFTIRAVKLELGTESTLALDVAPSYTEELLKCQRYYVPLKSYFSYVYGHSATTQIIRYPLATPMRTTPTLYGSATIEGGYNGSYQTETVATSDITIYNLDNIISMSISTTKSYDLGSCCTIGWSNAYLSAEL